MLAWLRWHLAKRRLASHAGKYPPEQVRFFEQRHRARSEDFPPNTEGYERLASVWDDFASCFVPGYDDFLAAAEKHYGQPIEAVLDLACGTGLLTRRIAPRAESVVGLDASEAMLREARSRTQDANARYTRGDFRNFELSETFDAALCGSDSLNYVETPGELADVFGCVARHLRSGGLFVFDVLDHRACRSRSRVEVVGEVKGQQFTVYLFYDAESRVSEARVVFEGVVERHRRVPIEEGDVRRAANEVGLVVAEHFASVSRFSQRLGFSARQFYVLRRP